MTLASTLPQNTGSGYVAAAYIVFFAIVLIYVAIMAIRLSRVERGLRDLRARAQAETGADTAGSDTAAATPTGAAAETAVAPPARRELESASQAESTPA